MRSPLKDSIFVKLDTVDSTQNYAAAMLRDGEAVGGVLSLEQTAGRGRFGRAWHSPPGECLAVSIVFRESVGHPRPYLLGMGFAVACAQAFECNVQWPNDVVYQSRKLGGILTELLPNEKGEQVPVVGIGINLNQASFPAEIASFATSVRLIHGEGVHPMNALSQILERFMALPELEVWADLEPIWAKFDTTAGKQYKLRDGQVATGLRLGGEGELICDSQGQEHRVLAADALMAGSLPG